MDTLPSHFAPIDKQKFISVESFNPLLFKVWSMDQQYPIILKPVRNAESQATPQVT